MAPATATKEYPTNTMVVSRYDAQYVVTTAPSLAIMFAQL